MTKKLEGIVLIIDGKEHSRITLDKPILFTGDKNTFCTSCGRQMSYQDEDWWKIELDFIKGVKITCPDCRQKEEAEEE